MIDINDLKDSDINRCVRYLKPPFYKGVIKSWNDVFIFIKYEDESVKTTSPDDLSFSDDMNGVDLIDLERKRQIYVEGFSLGRDSIYNNNGELAEAASAYAYPIFSQECENIPLQFPNNWEHKWWKPSPDDRIKELTKAGALIAAEIDRLLNKENER